MSLPEVSHGCDNCQHFDSKRWKYLKEPCSYRKRITKPDGYCVNFVQNERDKQPLLQQFKLDYKKMLT